jgi:peroxiredoxin
MRTLLLLTILITGFTAAFAQTEQAPIQQHEFKYKDWTYKSIRDDEKINLRQFTKDKKLVLVVYFAPWCHNWKHEAPFVQKMYEKYKQYGFDVIGVGEYDTVEAMKNGVDFFKISFPVVFESDSKDLRENTLHFGYRKETGDTRKWGSPWNVFLEPKDLKKQGETLTKESFVANGELIEPEAEKFIRQRLGLPTEEMKATTESKAVEVCDDSKTPEFKKP